MQNAYNNYLKRQKQKPMNNFKEKVANSLSGKALNNTTMPNTTPSQSSIQSAIQKKIQPKTTPTTTNNVTGGITTPVQTLNNTNTRTITPNVLQTPSNTSEGTSTITTPAPTTTTNQIASTTPTTQTTTPTTDVSATGNVGMMSLSDINSALATSTEGTDNIPTYAMARNATPTTASANSRTVTYNPLDQNAIVPGTGGMTQAEYEAEVKRKQEAGIALDNQELYNKYVNASTPYKYADQILQLQKEQAEKNWQLQEQMMQQQQSNLQQQYEQSVKDAESAYNKSVDTLNEQRYNQMQELNVSGTNRGIQYSPQQLGLENVANINHNKNLLEASNSRNELLNKLQIEINKSLAELNMSHLQSYNDYQSNLTKYQTDYYNQLMNWNREDSQTQSERDWEQQLLEEKRKWEEEQAQKDKDFEKLMQELQNNWQSNENALDRTHETNLNNSRSSSGYSGYSSGYSRSYSPYSRSGYSGYQNYDGGTASLDDEITQQAIDNEFKKLSTDAYNASDMGYVDSLMERASIYDELIDPMYSAYYGQNDTVDERLDNTRETALTHLLNKSIARSTNGAYNIGDTVYQELRPLRQSYIDNVNKHKDNLASRYYDRFSKDNSRKTRSNFKARLETSRNLMNDVRERQAKEKASSKTENKSSSKTSKSNEINKKFGAQNNKYYEKSKKSKEKQKETIKKVAKNVKKSTSNSVKNLKKNTNTKTSAKKTQQAIKKSNANVKKSLNNAKKNTKKSTSKSLSNLKKNISKMFKKKNK